MVLFKKLYLMCVILRLALVFVPQTGYIHPDEFFQTMEVAAGETLNIRHKVTWEFNSTRPIRSWTPIFLLVHLPLKLLSHVTSSISPYSILIFSRLPTALLSFSNDLFVYLLANHSHITPQYMALFFYAFSYTSMVHLTRTLSNSWECSFLSLIGCLVIFSMRESSSRMRNFICCILQAGLLAFAFFCRPTILLFAAPYLLINFYFLRSLLQRFLFSLVFPVAFLCFSLSIIYFDSQHYHQIDTKQMAHCLQSFKEFTNCFLTDKISITPLNFVLYNLNSDNLSQHGRHAWFTHIFINMPQLFGPFYVLALLAPILIHRHRRSHQFRQFKYQIVQRKATYLLLFASLLPLLALSCFCHQEARFLLPLCTVWSVIAAVGFQEYTLSQPTARSASNRSFRLLSLWMAFNLLGSLFWGFLHQGGLVKCLMTLHQQLQTSRPELTCSALVFYRTYMPPESLLMRSAVQNMAGCTEVFDLAGSEELEATNFLTDLVARMKNNKAPHKFIYLSFPYSGVPDFALSNSSMEALFEREFDSVFESMGHFSGEFLPDLFPHSWPDILNVWADWKKQLSLLTYKFRIL